MATRKRVRSRTETRDGREYTVRWLAEEEVSEPAPRSLVTLNAYMFELELRSRGRANQTIMQMLNGTGRTSYTPEEIEAAGQVTELWCPVTEDEEDEED